MDCRHVNGYPVKVLVSSFIPVLLGMGRLELLSVVAFAITNHHRFHRLIFAIIKISENGNTQVRLPLIASIAAVTINRHPDTYPVGKYRRH